MASAVWQPGQARPLSSDDKGKWDRRLDRSLKVAKEFHEQWKRGLTSYARAKVNKAKEDIDALLPYRHVESKKSQLFHRTPDVALLPIDPADQMIPYAALLPLRQKFLNYELGPKGANAKRALHKTLIDTLAASGFMIVKLGYEQIALPDPMTGLQVPIWSRRFITAVSSMKLLIPEDFHDTDFDAAPWLAVRGRMPVSVAKRLGWTIPDTFTSSTGKDESIFDHDAPEPDAADGVCEYTEVWYRASLFDAAVFNPELYRCLILVKGIDDPVWHVDSPYQTLTPQGQLTDDSLIGNPIHVGTLRDLIDSAYVPSDLVVGEQLATEENKFRTDLVKNRNARRPITLISDAIDDVTADKILKDRAAKVPAEHLLDGGNQRLVAVVQAGSEPRDNFTAQDYIERDFEQALGVSANQSGNFAKSKRTATEIRTVQTNSSARAETEKDRIREYFVALVRKFDVIVQRTATSQEVTKVLGQQGAALWEQWHALPGRYAYDIVPDSGRYVDAQSQMNFTLDVYNLLRKDARVNTDDLLEMVARALNRDPAKFIAPAQDKVTEAPNASVAFKGDDTLNPAMGNLLLDFCANAGIKLRPETIQAFKQQHEQQLVATLLGAQPGRPVGMTLPPGHGGSATRTEAINQHQTEKTGGVQGVSAA